MRRNTGAKMAPKPPTKASNKTKSSSKDSSKKPLSSSSSRVSKNKDVKRPPPKEVKSKPRSDPSNLKKKHKREYTDAELDLPKLNAITPVGVIKPKGKKKGKTFVDDKVCVSYSSSCSCEGLAKGLRSFLFLGHVTNLSRRV